MLIIISDLHLGDETTASSIPLSAFNLFATRIQETIQFASWRKDGKYQPIKNLDIVLMGDIIDPLHSTLWLDTMPGDVNYIRPWSDTAKPLYAQKLLQVTRAIIAKNKASLEILCKCASGELLKLPPATRSGKPDYEAKNQISVKARLHYMVGNHDWYYHLKGKAFDQIRQELIQAMGLHNSAASFPYELEEDGFIQDLFNQYKVFVRHGDYHDKFNFDREKGRDYATFGDAFTMDVCNRYPLEVEKKYKDKLSPAIIDSMRRMTNIRPSLVIPLWISGQIRAHAGTVRMERELKKVWDGLAEEFLQLDFVREADKAFKFDMVDLMQLVVKISSRASFSNIDDIVTWVHEKMWGGEHSFVNHALHEPAFLKEKARYVVYGHTHHHEIVPLDLAPINKQSQLYFNSGTWHVYYDLARRDPKNPKFVPYQALTYLTFYQEGEYDGRHFETWSGTYG